MRIIGWSLAFLLLAYPAAAQWERTVFSGKGESKDIPSAHRLKYFTLDPFQRDDANDFCVKCASSTGKGREARASGRYSITSEVQRVGVLGSFSIWDIFYRIRENHEPARFNGVPQGRVGWKSILAQTGPDQYIELYHLQASGPAPDLTAAKIVHCGDEAVLSTVDFDAGNAGGCWEGYWWFDRLGPHRIDFSSLGTAIASRLPAGARFSTTCSQLNLQEREIKSWVQKENAECRACGFIGQVTAHFRLRGSKVELTDVEFRAQPAQ